MEQFPMITQGIDWALLILYAFWLFFFGLVVYLVRENRREGYPLVDDRTGRPRSTDGLIVPRPKTFLTSTGEVFTAPRLNEVEPPIVNAVPANPFPGAPLIPVGDPMSSGVGPSAYVMRHDSPDLTAEHELKLIPMRTLPMHEVAEEDADPRGMEVVGADGLPAGIVEDLWIDRSEMMVRYLEVRLLPEIVRRTDPADASPPGEVIEAAAIAVDTDTGDAAVAVVTEPAHLTAENVDTVLMPMNVATLAPMYGQVSTPSILATHFADIPRIKNPDQVTLLEEDKIMAYFSAGELYATPGRSEPLL